MRACWLLCALAGCSELLGTNDFADGDEGPQVDLDVPGAGGADGTVDVGGGAPVSPWAQRFGSRETDHITSIALDGETAVIAGVMGNRVDFGGGLLGDGLGAHMFVARLALDGSHVSSIASGGDASVHIGGVAVDARGNAVIAGDFQGGTLAVVAERTAHTATDRDIFVAMVDRQGEEVWSNAYPSALEQQVFAVAVDGSEVIVVGSVRGTIDLGSEQLTSAGGEDAFVGRFDEGGDLVWAHLFGDGEDQRATAVTVAPDGAIWIAGVFAGAIDLSETHASIGSSDVFLARLDGGGNAVASARHGEGGAHRVGALAAADDRVVMVGDFTGATSLGGEPLQVTTAATAQQDLFVASYDGDGQHVWSRAVGGTGPEHAFAAAIGADGTIVVGGSHGSHLVIGGQQLQSAGGQDALALGFSSAGDIDWIVGFGRNEDDEVLAVAAGEGSALVGGRFHDAFTLGDGVISAVGGEDAFAAMLVP